MVLTIVEHRLAANAINSINPPSWVNDNFKKNWICRMDYKNSSHLDACLVDRELQQILHANLGQTTEGCKAKQYNHEVAHNADDIRYFRKPALPIYVPNGHGSTNYQWDNTTNKPALAALYEISSGSFAYDWDPNNPRTKANSHHGRIQNSTTRPSVTQIPISSSSAVVQQQPMQQPSSRSRQHGTQRRGNSLAPRQPTQMNRQQVANRIGNRNTSSSQPSQRRIQHHAQQRNSRFNLQQSNRSYYQQQVPQAQSNR